jgi:hypothetical protein
MKGKKTKGFEEKYRLSNKSYAMLGKYQKYNIRCYKSLTLELILD